jgi:hypothetical protein
VKAAPVVPFSGVRHFIGNPSRIDRSLGRFIALQFSSSQSAVASGRRSARLP